MLLVRLLAGIATVSLIGATAQAPHLLPYNNRSVAQGRHGTTGNFYPVRALNPPGFLSQTGVAAGSRMWVHVPDVRVQAGHVAGQYLTITGMTHDIHVGAATTSFPESASSC